MTCSANGTSSAAEPPVLEFRGITAGYGGSVVLRDVSIAVGRGSTVALLGPNGAGKTTLMRIASGLLRPVSGEVLQDGRDVTRASSVQRAHQGICLVPEGRGIFRSLSVRENLQLQVPRGRGGDHLEVAFDAFPRLRERARSTAGTLSGGEQQMLALARAFSSTPTAVLLDEVSMGLAPRIVDEIFDALKQLAATGVALLLVEQYVHRAIEMADQAYVLSRGAVTWEGSTTGVDPEALDRGYLGGQS